MKSFIRRYLLQPLGFFYETDNPEALLQRERGAVESETALFSKPDPTRWTLENVGLRPGWYMLEVVHSAASIGCVFTLDNGQSQREHLRLTSKGVCKRVVRLTTKSSRCEVMIDQPDCVIEHLALNIMSSRFAIRRMRSRVENNGGHDIPADASPDDVYQAYQAHIHNGVLPERYIPEPSCDVDVEHSEDAGRKSLIRLELIKWHSKNPQIVNTSIEPAVLFARQRGWDIEWHDALLSQGGSEGPQPAKKLYLMPLVVDAEYRVDVFHQMLQCIDQDTRLVYADHDFRDGTGTYLDPVLKPEWNPELLLNTNYIQLPWMISACRADLDVVGKDYGDDGWNMLLLSAAVGSVEGAVATTNCDSKGLDSAVNSAMLAARHEALTEQQVKRVPKVLASRLAGGPDKAASAIKEMARWRDCVHQALQVSGCDADVVESRYQDQYRVRWPLPEKLPSVDIIIPTRDQVAVLKKCIDSVLEKTTYPNFRLLVIDNDSQDPATELYYRSLEQDSRFNLARYPGPFNYSAINNFAVSRSNADVVVLLNNDTEVIAEHWLDELVRHAVRPEIGCVGAKLHYSNGRIQHGGVVVGIAGVAGHAHRYCRGTDDGYCGRLKASQNITAVTAACLAVRRSVFADAGGLDEQHLAVAWNDVDFCLKVQALGYRNVWTPHAQLYHHEGLSRGADDTRGKIERVDKERRVMIERWGLDTFDDPAYHPLLTRDHEAFGLGQRISL